MNKVKISLFALAAVMAVGSAYGGAKRAIKYYVQDDPGSGKVWRVLTTLYDPGQCTLDNDTYCIYTVVSTAVLPTNPTTTQLVTAGATHHISNKAYDL
ncbi:hypothetical protein GA0116948_10150 [Chitinophaga costaii]|uniref:Uncharacterized protein n=1 Tax=Chitinophaga costaii TaxID=1335309 RepID=A0A1C3YQM3_9BACT|nr:hypothetical protein [Chitinophaga costaii]PUZ30059.1 hypothetical protein DCM91_00840 [Chitinophaga costaii]SCB72415.1 hypothetical protein GA0116948_10150 [Chitinophaga costaii]